MCTFFVEKKKKKWYPMAALISKDEEVKVKWRYLMSVEQKEAIF